MQGQQYKWPQRVTTGSWAESKQMLQSKLPLEFSEAASEAEMAFHFFWSETSPSDSCCAASSGKSCSKAMRSEYPKMTRVVSEEMTSLHKNLLPEYPKTTRVVEGKLKHLQVFKNCNMRT